MQKSESDPDDENLSEKEEDDKEKAHNRSSKKILNEDQDEPVKKTTTVETGKSNERTPKKSTSKIARNDNTSKSKQSASKKQKTVRENQNSKGKGADKKPTDKSSKALVKDEGWVFVIVVYYIICTKSNASCHKLLVARELFFYAMITFARVFPGKLIL